MAYFEDLQVSGIVDAQQLNAHVVIVLKAVQLLNVAADPTVAPGVAAPLGSLALLAGSGIWQKTGPLDTNWTALVGGGGIVGPGTINTVSKFTAANTVGDSQITDDGNAVIVNGATDVTVNASDQLLLVGAGVTPGVTIQASASDVHLSSVTGVVVGEAGEPVSLYGEPPIARQTVTGSRTDGVVALTDLLAKLDNIGIIIDGTTP